MIYLIDPPSGWKFGFPKEYNDEVDPDINKWLVDNGYPQKIIDQFCGEVPYWISEK